MMAMLRDTRMPGPVLMEPWTQCVPVPSSRMDPTEFTRCSDEARGATPSVCPVGGGRDMS